jgi:hypothetical protein
MTTKTTTINGFRVTIDTDMGDGATGCWIESRTNFSASLECADATGCLQNDHGDEQKISPTVVDRIRDWAEANGY